MSRLQAEKALLCDLNDKLIYPKNPAGFPELESIQILANSGQQFLLHTFRSDPLLIYLPIGNWNWVDKHILSRRNYQRA